MERVVTGQWWRGLKAPWMSMRTGSGALAVLGEQVDSRISEGFSNQKNSVILLQLKP